MGNAECNITSNECVCQAGYAEKEGSCVNIHGMFVIVYESSYLLGFIYCLHSSVVSVDSIKTDILAVICTRYKCQVVM